MRHRWPASPYAAYAVLMSALIAGCGGDGGTEPPALASLQAVAGNGQVGVAGHPLPAPLVAEAHDGGGHALANITLQFSVTQGGGQLDQTERTTDAQGRASVTFTLGTTPGSAQQVRVTAAGTDITTSFSATATSPPTTITPSAGNGQSARAGVALPVSPQVRVTDNGGNPVGGVTVHFQVTRGGGTLSGDVKVTDASGLAAADAWTMGRSGVNVVEATVDNETLDGEPATFVATTTPADGLDIVVRFVGTATASQLLAFAEAEVRWESVITNDLPDAHATAAAGDCGDGVPAVDEDVDDLLILASVQSIDGIGSVLARAGPCLLRDMNGNSNIDVGDFPGMGVMFFDEADVDNEFATTVLHEMGHVLGFGVLWGFQGLLADPSLPPNNGTDPHFTGAQAIAAFNASGGSTYTDGAKVPVENFFGEEGTKDKHWRELVFETELMTGVLDPGAPEPLSAITIASFADQGYTVNQSAADPYTLPFGAARVAGSHRRIELVDDIAHIPIRLVAPDGRVTQILRP
jgi:hypothetical protein